MIIEFISGIEERWCHNCYNFFLMPQRWIIKKNLPKNREGLLEQAKNTKIIKKIGRASKK